MINSLDILLNIISFFIIISGLLFFGYNLLNIKFISPWDRTINKNEEMLKLISNKWFYIPFSILIINILLMVVVKDAYEKKVYSELITKINSYDNKQFDFNKYVIKPLSKSSRFYIDKKLKINLDENYKIELQRNIDDTTSYYVFVLNYNQSSQSSIAYIIKK